MKKSLWALLLLTLNLEANEALTAAVSKPTTQKTPKKISYDTDLFRKNKKVLFVNAEFLYWTVNEGALDYALKMKSPAWGSPTEGVGHYKNIDFGWDPGFRVNFGYFNAPHYWDTFVQFTYFKGTGSDHTHAPSSANEFLNGTWAQPSFDSLQNRALVSAHSSIEMKLYLLDAFFTRRFHPNPHLRMRLYGGPTVAWIRQGWKVRYKDTAQETTHLRNHWRFTGAGIRAGYMVDWFLGKGGFFFTGLVSAAVYAGNYHNVGRQTSSYIGNGQFNPNRPLRATHLHDTRLIPHVQILGGPSWQMAFKKYRTEIFAGYELNFWTNLHEVYRTSTSAPSQAKQTYINTSVMGLQGLTVRWNLDF